MYKFSLRLITSLVAASVFLPSAAFAETAYSPEDDELVTFIVETDFNPVAEYTAIKNMGISLFADIDEDEIAEGLLEENSEILSAAAEELDADTSDSFVYTRLFSGFSITARRGDMNRLLAIDGVVSVSEDGVLYTIDDEPTTDAEIIDTQTNTSYNGKGTAIAIIDSGFELGHDYFNVSVNSPKYNRTDIESKINGTLSSRGKYYSEKIPFTYDYNEKSSDDSKIGNASEHGTHVAGIAAGKNGKISNGDTINGVAPEAQLVLMACANSSGSLPFTAILAALNDAAVLDVDVINMSLGLPYVDIRSGYTTILDSIAAARSAGIPVCVSSGNEARGFYTAYPSVLNPDYGAEGVFAKDTDTFSVASAELPSYYMETTALLLGDETTVSGLNVSIDGIGDFSYEFTAATEYIDCGTGQTTDFTDKNVKDKIALIQRGDGLSFAQKTENAKAAGAAGVIIYNTEDEYISIAGCTLPTMFVTASTGKKLLECETKTVRVSGTTVDTVQSASGNQPSSFTSWGVTEDLELTPNITAYGGNIYSAAPNNSYQTMSGTSMSSPYIAGISACVKEYLNTKPFGELTGVNTADLIQQLLMSTAEPLRNPDETDSGSALPYSPRQQGAGLVNLNKALTTPVVLYNSDGKTLVNLGDEIDNTFTLSFKVCNYSNEAVTFNNVSLETVTDGFTQVTDTEEIIAYGTNPLTVNSYTKDDITVAAGETRDVTIDVALNSDQLEEYAAVFKNGFYIDGFLRLSNDDYSVGLPFMGFRGDWGKVPMWDSTVYDEGGSTLITTYGGNTYDFSTYLLTSIDNTAVQLNKGYMILSPNGDGKADSISAAFALYRASSTIKLEMIKDEVVILTQTKNDRYSKFSKYTLACTEDLSVLEDGEYTFRLTGYADNGNGGTTAQTLDFPIIIDKTAPKITKTMSEDGNTLTVKAEDANYLRSVTVSYTDTDGTPHSETVTLDNTATSYESIFTLANANPMTITVAAEDYAYNTAVSYDLTIPVKVNDITSTAFKSIISNADTETRSITGAIGTVTSNDVTKAFEGSFEQTITIDSGSSCIIGVIVEGLYDPNASIQIELK